MTEYLEIFTCVIFAVLSIVALIYMVKTDARAKRGRIYERIEAVEDRVAELEKSALVAERDYWRKKAEGQDASGKG